MAISYTVLPVHGVLLDIAHLKKHYRMGLTMVRALRVNWPSGALRHIRPATDDTRLEHARTDARLAVDVTPYGRLEAVRRPGAEIAAHGVRISRATCVA